MGYKSKVLEVYVLNKQIISAGEDNNRQTDRQTGICTIAKRHKLEKKKFKVFMVYKQII